MTKASSKILWVRSFHTKLGPKPMFCDNQAAILIVNNPTFQECTKNFEIDWLATRRRINSTLTFAPHVGSLNQLADILTKGLRVTSYDTFSHKMGLFDVYALG